MYHPIGDAPRALASTNRAFDSRETLTGPQSRRGDPECTAATPCVAADGCAPGANEAHQENIPPTARPVVGWDSLHTYALEAVLDQCSLAELARMSQVDRNSRDVAMRVVTVKWSEARRANELIAATLADDAHAIHFARRAHMKIDHIRVGALSLLGAALERPLDKGTYAALLQMTEAPGKNLWAPFRFRNNPGFLLAAIKAKCPEAISAYLDSSHYERESEPSAQSARLIQAINHGNAATLRALVESGRFDVNALHLGQSVLRHEIARCDHDMTRLAYLLSLPTIDVNSGGLPAAPLGADLEKYRLYLADPRVDVNRVINVRQRGYQSSPLNVAVKLALFFFDTRIFDLLITDPRLNVNITTLQENGRQMTILEAIAEYTRQDTSSATRDIAHYLEEKIVEHPNYRRRGRAPLAGILRR